MNCKESFAVYEGDLVSLLNIYRQYEVYRHSALFGFTQIILFGKGGRLTRTGFQRAGTEDVYSFEEMIMKILDFWELKEHPLARFPGFQASLELPMVSAASTSSSSK